MQQLNHCRQQNSSGFTGFMQYPLRISDTIGKDFLTLKDVESEIPVSKQYYSKFIKKIKILDASVDETEIFRLERTIHHTRIGIKKGQR